MLERRREQKGGGICPFEQNTSYSAWAPLATTIP